MAKKAKIDKGLPITSSGLTIDEFKKKYNFDPTKGVEHWPYQKVKKKKGKNGDLKIG